jgi:hypothetical protein
MDLLLLQDIYKLTRICRYMYSACLPCLYSNLEHGYRIHTRQLLVGINTQYLLQQNILDYTRKLTFISRQTGNQWHINDLLQILGPFSNIEMLIFRDFHELSTDTVQHIVSIYHNLNTFNFNIVI